MKNNQCVHHDEVGSMCPTVLYFYLMLIQHHVIPWYPVKNTYSISALQTPTPTVLLGVKKKHSIVQNHIEMVWQNVITVCWVKHSQQQLPSCICAFKECGREQCFPTFIDPWHIFHIGEKYKAHYLAKQLTKIG